MRKIFPVFTILMGVYWIFCAFDYGLWVRRGPGGGFFPLIGGLLAVAFSLVYLRAEFKNPKPASIDPKFLYPVLSVLAVLLLSYVFGLLPCMLLFIFFWLWKYEKYSIRFSAVVSLCTMAAIYLVFVYWLSVQMPQGMVGNQVMDWWYGIPKVKAS